MGSTFACCACEADATTYGIDELKRRLEGQTKVIQPIKEIDPEVHVTFLEVTKADSGSIKFSPLKFTLRDLIFRTSVEVRGSNLQIAAAMATRGTAIAAKKAGASADTASKLMGGVMKTASKVIDAKDKAMDKLGIASNFSTKVVKVSVTVDLVKEHGAEEVQVKIKDFQTDHDVAEKVLTLDVIRKQVEAAISAKASEVATRMAREKQEMLLEKVGLGATR
mmetsp:Transcript_114850/g.324591  ORF Transcript_114850/g.324591 Transcript_114850/m.324591 type:complete len:222 (+) Transcript_114850:87-752(+)